MLASATPDAAQQKDIDFAFGVGRLFSLVPYAQLILEEAPLSGVDEALIDEIFGLLVRDFNSYAVELSDKAATTDEQVEFRVADDPPARARRGALRPRSGRTTSCRSTARTRCARNPTPSPVRPSYLTVN